ncbi:MAG: hypothetical protein IJ196_07210 [Prevotella sp.]|nr:hypothetical protein [Prevotella sp.]
MNHEPDSIAFFRGLSVSGDLVGVLQRQLGSYGQYEGALHVNLKDKYFPVVELGIGEADADDIVTQLKYKTRAPYGKVGCDFNMMKNKHDKYRVYGGLRYAYTSFKYDVLSPGLHDPIWQEQVAFGAEGINCYQHWLEGVFTIDAYIWGPLRMGWSVRYKRRVAHDHNSMGSPWYVPGYGKAGNSRLGGTFNITFEI